MPKARTDGILCHLNGGQPFSKAFALRQMASPLPIQPTMLRLNKAQRGILTDKIPALANVAAGAMIFGQVLSQRRFSVFVAAGGIAIWLLLTGCAMVIAKGEHQ